MSVKARAGIVSSVILLMASRVPTTNASNPRTVETDRAAIIALENDWLDHISDGATLNRVLAEDFVHPIPQGLFLTKQQHIDWAVKHPHPANRKAGFEKIDVRLYGDMAIANGTVSVQEGSDSKSHRTIFTDVFVYRAERWQAVNAQENAIAGEQ
jgi:hypothetical protein